MSALKTKNRPEGLLAKRISYASLIGPAVPSGSVSNEHVIFTPYWQHNKTIFNDLTYLFLPFLEMSYHHLGLIVNRENNFCDTYFSECLNLMTEDWFIAKVNHGFRYSECHWSQSCSISTNEN